MIFIDLSNFTPDDNWLYNAWQINAELMSKTSLAEKNQFIDENRNFWSSLKNSFPFNDKCWYSEAKESVSVYEIEHFRPIKATCKSTSVSKKLKHFVEEQRVDWVKATKYRGGGYWWLAFDYKNYRNCGQKINNIKSIRFPIKLSSFIAYRETQDYKLEEIILLDPTKQGDPDLLTFDPDGTAKPTKTDITEFDFIRAFASIEIFGLNKIEPLVRHRQTKWSECFKAIRRATKKFHDVEKAGVAGDDDKYNKLFDEFMDFVDNDIKPAIESHSEFSAVAKACVMSYTALDWINKYVLN